MSLSNRTRPYVTIAQRSIGDPILQNALAGLQERLGKGALNSYTEISDSESFRKKAHEIRMNAIDNLDFLLERLADKIEENGGFVHFAPDAKSAVTYCIDIAKRNGVRRIVKGKSMVTEEIGLNSALESENIEVTETDLGEYIIQLAGEGPSHIIAPAIHKTREQVGALFSEKLGIPYTDDPPTLTAAARKALREKFFAADMGVTGCNLACAETGHITTVSNEGNIRMSSTLPRIHMAFMGMERVTAKLTDHAVLFDLLPRAAIGKNMSGYISYVGGPRQSDHVDGPEEFHLVIIDNGRSRILADKNLREILCCVRCAACLNVCPVYRKIGGYAYQSPYCGPIGSVITPLLRGVNDYKDLCQGETLCGACKNICPVHIDLPRLLLELRKKLADGDPEWDVTRANPFEKAVFMVWSMLIRNRDIYDLFLKTSGFFQKFLPRRHRMIHRLPPPFHGWTDKRDLPPLASESFIQRWERMKKNG